jgi:hypothetical protein
MNDHIKKIYLFTIIMMLSNIYSENNLMSLNSGLLGDREGNIRKLFLWYLMKKSKEIGLLVMQQFPHWSLHSNEGSNWGNVGYNM